MRPKAFPLPKGSTFGILVLLALIVVTPKEASAYYQDTPEPPPRPTPTATPYIEVVPTEGIAEEDFSLTVRGYFWPTTTGGITLYWDGQHLSGPHPVDPNGTFEIGVVVPAAWASVGSHTVEASHNLGYAAQASVFLIQPTPTPTFTPSPTPTPTCTPSPTPSPTPVTPTLTPTPTPTPTRTPTLTPSPTLAPLTPIVTETPYSKATKVPTLWPTLPPLPTQTSLPLTPSPTPDAMLTASLTPTASATPTETPSPTPTDTPSPTPTLTPTDTPTPTPTETPSPAPIQAQGAPIPTATAQEVSLVPFLNQPGLPNAGTNWEASFATGFIVAIWVIVLLIAFLVTVLIVLVVVWRLFVRRQPQQG